MISASIPRYGKWHGNVLLYFFSEFRPLSNIAAGR